MTQSFRKPKAHSMNGDGKVAVHRWFADGENWAIHPWFAGRERQLMAALAPHLHAATGEFAVGGFGGTLIGETVPDPDCPDPKARSRHPTILRAVFVSHAPTERQRRKLMADLRGLDLPPVPGADSQLEIHAPYPGPTQTPISPNLKSKKPLLVLVAAAVGILALTVAVAAWMNSGEKDHSDHGQPPDTKPAVPPNTAKSPPVIASITSDDTDLVPVRGEVPYLDQRTSRRFQQILGLSAKYDHPYVVFLSDISANLPESAPSCKDSSEVRQGLRSLLEALKPGDDTAAWETERLRKAIDAAMNYDAWRQKAGRRVYRDRVKPLDEPLRRFVESFRSPDPELKAAAVAVGELLESWGESGAKMQAARQPLAAIDRFFAILTRPANLPTLGKVDHPYIAFLRRLPPESASEGQTFDDAGDLGATLRHLLYLLDREFVPSADHASATALVRKIGEQMDYSAWIKTHKETFRDSTVELSPEIKRAMKRFSR